jgi:hypothetical protein
MTQNRIAPTTIVIRIAIASETIAALPQFCRHAPDDSVDKAENVALDGPLQS